MKKQNKVAFFNILSTVLLRGLSIFTAPLFSRLLGDAGYGIVSVYLVWVGVLQIAFTFQTYGSLVNARIEYPEDRQKAYQSSVMSLSLIFYLICTAAVVLFLDPISNLLQMDRMLIILLLVQSFAGFSTLFINSKFTYEFRADLNCLISVGVAVLTLVLSLLFIWWLPDGQEYFGRILALVITNGVFGYSACVYILVSGKTFYNKEFWKFCLTLSLPLVFYNLSDLVLGQSDRLMLQHMLSESMVGQYSLAYNFAGIIFTIFGALNNSWVPFFFEDMKQGHRDAMKAQARNFLELYTVLSAGFILLATEVYHVFASEEFWAGTMLIPVFTAGYYFNFLCTFPINYEYFHKKTKVVAIVTVVAAVFNIGLNYVLINNMGLAGATLATAISHGLQFAMHYVYVRYKLGKKDYPFGIRIWLPYAACFGAVMAVVYLVPDSAVVRWGLGIAIGLWEVRRVLKRKVLI